MVGINVVQVDAAGGRHAAPSLIVNGIGRKLQFQARNGGCSGRLRIGVSGGWNVSGRNLRICKIQDLEYQGFSGRGRANVFRIKRNEVEYWNGAQRTSRKVIRAGTRLSKCSQRKCVQTRLQSSVNIGESEWWKKY